MDWKALADWLDKHLMTLVTGVAVAGIAVLALRPGPPDPTGDDVAKAWNDSIARLGIQPVYPPEEDLVVGDIWVSGILGGVPEERPLE